MNFKKLAATAFALFLVVSTLSFYAAMGMGGGYYTSASTTTTGAAISSKTITLAASGQIRYSCIFVIVEVGKVTTVTVTGITDSLSNSYLKLKTSDITSDVEIWGANNTSSSTASNVITVTLSGATTTGTVLIAAFWVTGMYNGGCTAPDSIYANHGTGTASATAQLAAGVTPQTGDFCLIGYGEQITDTVAPTFTAQALPLIQGPTLGTPSTSVSYDELHTTYLLNYLPVYGTQQFPLVATGGTVTVFDWDMAVVCMPGVLYVFTTASTVTSIVTTGPATTTTTATSTTTTTLNTVTDTTYIGPATTTATTTSTTTTTLQTTTSTIYLGQATATVTTGPATTTITSTAAAATVTQANSTATTTQDVISNGAALGAVIIAAVLICFVLIAVVVAKRRS